MSVFIVNRHFPYEGCLATFEDHSEKFSSWIVSYVLSDNKLAQQKAVGESAQGSVACF
jgi:hypothetical protein